MECEVIGYIQCVGKFGLILVYDVVVWGCFVVDGLFDCVIIVVDYYDDWGQFFVGECVEFLYG